MPRDDPAAAFLGVTRSATGRRWVGPSLEETRLAEALGQRAGLEPALAGILARRGIAPEGVEAYLSPTLRDLLPDPLALRDMEVAAERVARAVADGERIAIFADYDVDGGASAAVLLTWLRGVGRTATLYVPDRLSEGFGPNVPAMASLAAEHDLVVCVDCGTLSHDAIAAAGTADVLVIDHHQGAETPPPALGVVNPNRQDESGALGHLCAAAVVFLMLVEVTRRRRAAGRDGPDLMALLDLVALATVADVAPLTGLNRAFVRQGLRVMHRRARPGLAALADAARLDGPARAHHLGFLLGPRINAGGRIGAPDLGARLLATADPAEAEALAQRLERLNAERREIDARVTAAARAQAEARGLDAPLVWAAGEGWHPGVVGIAAARLKEASGRPSVVLGLADGLCTGSARSIPGIDLGAAVRRLAAEGWLEKGGGHAMAAGLTVARDRLEPAMARLGELLARQGACLAAPDDLALDGLLMPGAATLALADRIEAAGPFGAGAPAPRFAFADVAVSGVRRLGEAHLGLDLGDTAGPRLPAIAFGAFEGPLGTLLSEHGGVRFAVVGRLEVNAYRCRRSAQLVIEDAAPATGR